MIDSIITVNNQSSGVVVVFRLLTTELLLYFSSFSSVPGEASAGHALLYFSDMYASPLLYGTVR